MDGREAAVSNGAIYYPQSAFHFPCCCVKRLCRVGFSISLSCPARVPRLSLRGRPGFLFGGYRSGASVTPDIGRRKAGEEAIGGRKAWENGTNRHRRFVPPSAAA
ncbi:MAG: hypothetical protein MdMp014T_1318 [Treponematales bacterium]